MSDEHGSPKHDAPNLWIGPLIALVVIVVPIAILVFSNTDSATVQWAGVDWEAPLWLVLAITFVAGAVGSRLFGAAWRVWRRRRRRIKDELEVLKRHEEQGGG